MPGLRRLPLRGFERFGTMVDDAAMKIATVMLVKGDAEALRRHLPQAAANTFNAFPRMRLTQARDEPFTGEIQPPVTLETLESDALLHVRDFSADINPDTTHDWADWDQFVLAECETGFDRYAKPMFYLRAWVDPASSQARLMLFSDHILSDGRAGLMALNSVLENVALIDRGVAPARVQEKPLYPSLYDVWFDETPFWFKPAATAVTELFAKPAFHKAAAAFEPVLPRRADYHDYGVPMQTNKSNGFFADGDPAAMRAMLQRCKQESASFGGALVANIVLAYFHASKKHRPADFDGLFRLVADTNYDMRLRLPQLPLEDSMGVYVAIAGLEWLVKEGVDVKNTKFWDLARRANAEIHANIESPFKLALGTFSMDRKMHPGAIKDFLGDVRIPNSVMGDVNISNIGRYPYSLEHELAAPGSKLSVETTHSYSCSPLLGPSSIMWVSAARAFNYSMVHKCEDEDGQALFNALVALNESAGAIGPDDSLLDVLKRVGL